MLSEAVKSPQRYATLEEVPRPGPQADEPDESQLVIGSLDGSAPLQACGRGQTAVAGTVRPLRRHIGIRRQRGCPRRQEGRAWIRHPRPRVTPYRQVSRWSGGPARHDRREADEAEWRLGQASNPFQYPPLAVVRMGQHWRAAGLGTKGVWVVESTDDAPGNASLILGGQLPGGDEGGAKLQFTADGEHLMLVQQRQFGRPVTVRLWDLRKVWRDWLDPPDHASSAGNVAADMATMQAVACRIVRDEPQGGAIDSTLGDLFQIAPAFREPCPDAKGAAAMKSLFEPAVRTWQGWRSGSTPLPEIAAIPPERCEPAGSAGTVIRRDRMYFTVRLNEMYLAENRQWWAVYDPLVVIVIGFNHGGARVTVPAIIGPDLIKRQSPEDQPRFGVVLRNVRVTGPHPYRGGDIDVSLALYRLQRTDHARSLLNIVDGIASSIGGPGEMATALRFGGALLDGVQALLGLQNTEYLAGQRISVATSAVDPLTEQYCALVAPPTPPSDGTPCAGVTACDRLRRAVPRVGFRAVEHHRPGAARRRESSALLPVEGAGDGGGVRRRGRRQARQGEPAGGLSADADKPRRDRRRGRAAIRRLAERIRGGKAAPRAHPRHASAGACAETGRDGN